MQFYMPSINTEVSESYLQALGVPLDNQYAQLQMGIYTLHTPYQEYDIDYQYLGEAIYKQTSEYAYIRSNVIRPLPDDVLLNKFKYENGEKFLAAFPQIDAKCARPSQDILARIAMINELNFQRAEFKAWQDSSAPGSPDQLKATTLLAEVDTLEEALPEDSTVTDEAYLLSLRTVQEMNRQKYKELQATTSWQVARDIVPIIPL